MKKKKIFKNVIRYYFWKENKLLIKQETNSEYVDMHNGYISNKIVGLTIYNSLIDYGFVELDKVDINWKEFREFKLKNNILW